MPGSPQAMLKGGRLAGVAMLAGMSSVLAFEPFGWFPIAFLSLAVLVALIERAPAARWGFVAGFGWGLGAFVAGVSWLYVALNRYGGVPMPLAALAIVLFCAYLALFPALACAAYAWLRRRSGLLSAALFAACWVLGELLRGWLFTGFPWLAIGYSQTPPSPLAGFAPVLGIYGLGGLVALGSAILGLTAWRAPGGWRLPAVTVLLLGVGGQWLHGASWSQPFGDPVRVALVQTSIEQDLKWEPEHLARSLTINAELSDVAEADLVVLPETTLPLLVENVPRSYLDGLSSRARERSADLVVGVFRRDEEGRIYNAAMSFGASAPQHYAKQHLVPFGEFSPPLFGWFYRLANIPMSDQSPGRSDQRPMELAGQRIAVNICYEDLFGRELLRTLPEATLMLNLSNLAWYGDSIAQPQHLQIARMRALETGRPMLRATNTGMTALVLPDGQVEAVLPAFERGVLQVTVRGHEGLTPYARWGDGLAGMLAVLIVGTCAMNARRKDRAILREHAGTHPCRDFDRDAESQ
jgi:apolipoprotein N-acyltransferase